MKNLLKISFRNMSRQKKRSLLLAGAIAFGILVITTLGAFSKGMIIGAKENISNMYAGHIFIKGTQTLASGMEVNVIKDEEILNEVTAVCKNDIEKITRRTQSFSYLIGTYKEVLCNITGIHFDLENQFLLGLNINEETIKSLNRKSILIPEKTLEKLKLQVGETVLVRLSTVSGQQNAGEFIIAGIIKDSGTFGISAAYCDIGYLNELMNLKEEQYQSYNIFLKDVKKVDRTADLIYKELAANASVTKRAEKRTTQGSGMPMPDGQGGGMGMMGGSGLKGFFGAQKAKNITGEESYTYSLSTINERTEQLTNVVTLLDTISLSIFIVLLLITMVGITNTFRMIMLERIQEIGTMRSIGMRKNDVVRLFVFEALYITLTGALCGLILSVILMSGLGIFTIPSGTPLSMFVIKNHLVFSVSFSELIRNLLLICIITILSAFFPAKNAAALNPANALQKTY